MAQAPLQGKRILVTRPLQQAARFCELLRQAGAEPVELPLISIAPPDSWEAFDTAFRNLHRYSWVVFASASAVDTTLQRADELGLLEQLKNKRIACIGPSTAAELANKGLQTSLIPKTYIAESLLAEFPAANPEPHNRILWTRTNIGRNLLKDGLEKKGWIVDVVHSYKTEGPVDPQSSAAQLKALLEMHEIDAISVTSSEVARRLKEILEIASSRNQFVQNKWLSEVKLAAIGPETARTCCEELGRVDVQPTDFTAAGLVEALKQAFCC